MLSITGGREKESQAVGAEIESYTPSINPGQRQVPKIETIKVEQGEITGLNKNLPSAYKVLPCTSAEINQPLYPPPQWGTRVVYDEPPTSRLTPTAPLLESDSDADSDTDVQDTDVTVDSESDKGASSILLGNDDWVQVSEQLPPVRRYNSAC